MDRASAIVPLKGVIQAVLNSLIPFLNGRMRKVGSLRGPNGGGKFWGGEREKGVVQGYWCGFMASDAALRFLAEPAGDQGSSQQSGQEEAAEAADLGGQVSEVLAADEIVSEAPDEGAHGQDDEEDGS